MSTVSAPRRSLNARQAETVDRLFDAAAEVLDEVGHEQATIRMIAARAQVSAATGYTYFSSKEHLFAELFWRRIASAPDPELSAKGATERLEEMADYLAGVLSASPALAAAANKSLLGGDPEMERLRAAIGGTWIRRFKEALGPDADPDVITTLALTFTGALLQAGMGVFDYADLAGQLHVAIRVVMRGQADS